MMTLQIVQLLDVKTNAWSVPHFVPSVAGWTRALQDEINSGKRDQPFAAHPQDFTAHHVGEWNDETNLFELFPQRKFLTQLSDLVIAKN